MGLCKVIIESDSTSIITIINRGNHENHSHKILNQISDWQQWEWELKVCHTSREGNRCADWLANWSLDQELGLHWLDVPPVGLARLIFSDASSASILCVFSSM